MNDTLPPPSQFKIFSLMLNRLGWRSFLNTALESSEVTLTSAIGRDIVSDHGHGASSYFELKCQIENLIQYGYFKKFVA